MSVDQLLTVIMYTLATAAFIAFCKTQQWEGKIKIAAATNHSLAVEGYKTYRRRWAWALLLCLTTQSALYMYVKT